MMKISKNKFGGFLFILGLFAISAGYFLNVINPQRATPYFYILIFMGVLCLSLALCNNFDQLLSTEKSLKYNIKIFIIWNLILIFRDFPTDYGSLYYNLVSEYGIWIYLIPLLVFYKPSESLYKSLVFAFTSLGIFFIMIIILKNRALIDVTNMVFSEQAILIFASGCGFLLLSSTYQSVLSKYIGFIVVVISLVISLFLARRNVIITFLDYIIFSFIIYICYFNKQKPIKKGITLLMVSLVVCLIVGHFFKSFSNNNNSFVLLKDKGLKNTREIVFEYFFEDMTTKDFVIGRGMNGKYYAPITNEESQGGYRYTIENGFLFYILKGGLIELALLFVIFIRSMYLGFFRSNNGLVKVFASIILLWIIDMGPFGLPCLSSKYILVWIAIGGCINESIRRMNDKEVKKFFL